MIRVVGAATAPPIAKHTKMKTTYTIKLPDGTLAKKTGRDAVTIGWNRGELTRGCLIQQEGSSEWTDLGDFLGVPDPNAGAETAGTDSARPVHHKSNLRMWACRGVVIALASFAGSYAVYRSSLKDGRTYAYSDGKLYIRKVQPTDLIFSENISFAMNGEVSHERQADLWESMRLRQKKEAAATYLLCFGIVCGLGGLLCWQGSRTTRPN